VLSTPKYSAGTASTSTGSSSTALEYGISYVGGVGFRDDPHLVRLADLGLRPTERFVYDYDFTDGWRLDLRLEQILVMDPGRVYPRCTGGPLIVTVDTVAGSGVSR